LIASFFGVSIEPNSPIEKNIIIFILARFDLDDHGITCLIRIRLIGIIEDRTKFIRLGGGAGID